MLRLLIIGLIIGTANIIPGVSGGTMMVVFNVFDTLIGAIANFKKDVKGSLKILIPTLIGAGVGIVAFAGLITWLLEYYPKPTNFFFIGLMLGSLPMLARRAFKGKKNAGAALSFLAGLAVMACMLLFSGDGGQSAVVKMDVITFVLLFVAGAIAAMAMLIPGISGSFLLLILGVYGTVTAAIASCIDIVKALLKGSQSLSPELFAKLLPIIPIGLGVLAGLLGGAKLIDILVKKHAQMTYACILGLVIGSAVVIFPGLAGGMQALASITAVLSGGALAYVFSPRNE